MPAPSTSERSELRGVYYHDGRTAARHEARISVGEEAVDIVGSDGAPLARWPLISVRRSGPRHFGLDEGDARLVVDDPDLAAFLGRRAAKAARPYRRGMPRVFQWAGLVIAGLCGAFVAVAELLPGMAEHVPVSWEVALGDEIRDDALSVFKRISGGDGRTCSSAEGSEALAGLATRLAAAAGAAEFPFSVTVVDLTLQNAVALPGGRIMLFRGLLNLAERPDEIAAVLAHEMAHGIRRHPLRALIRSEGIGVLSSLVLPDGIAGRVDSGVAQVLLHTSYSRQAEAEADALAFAALRRAGIRADGMASLFERLREKYGAGRMPTLLSTHPDIEERIAEARAQPGGGDALTDAEWTALRRICEG